MDERHPCETWGALFPQRRILVVRSVARARQLLRQALSGIATGGVTLPANADAPLLRAWDGVRVQFAGLDENLGWVNTPRERLAWMQPVAGLNTSILPNTWTVCDFALTLPASLPRSSERTIFLFGLHLNHSTADDGALLVFDQQCQGVFASVAAQLTTRDLPDAILCQAQFERWYGSGGLAAAHQQILAELVCGIHEAAGLETLPLGGPALSWGVAVYIPAETNAATFHTYARRENTPLAWLTELQPLHYRAAATHRASAENLERWLLLPASPFYTEKEIRGAVLGVVKAAEYLGVRWRTNLQQAQAYAALMDAMYGPGHDAYRPAFEV